VAFHAAVAHSSGAQPAVAPVHLSTVATPVSPLKSSSDTLRAILLVVASAAAAGLSAEHLRLAAAARRS
jgi:hypothetical protein